MKKSDFRIGDEFFTAAGRWQCTDIGTRTIIAIKKNMDDESWYNGPPYAVAEEVFHEYDFEGCVETYQLAVEDWGDSFVAAEKKRGKIITRKVSVTRDTKKS